MDKQHLTQATEQLPVELQQRQGQHPHVILSQPPPNVVQVTHDTQQSSSCSTVHPHYFHRAALVCALLQMACGVVIAVLFYLLIGVFGLFYALFSMLWFIAGAFGAGSAWNKKTCLIITTKVLSILSALSASYILLGGVAIYFEELDTEEQQKSHLGLSMAVFSAVECVASVTAAALCCKAICPCCQCCCECCCQDATLRAANRHTRLENVETPQPVRRVLDSPQDAVQGGGINDTFDNW